MCNDERSSETVCFAPDNTRSAREDIAGIEKKSIAIDDNKGNQDLLAGLIHQDINVPPPMPLLVRSCRSAVH